METYGIITTCKGRLSQLQQTLPRMLSQPGVATVTVVDYGCPDGTFQWCLRQNDERLRAILVQDGTEYFSRPRAKNIGAVRTDASVLCFVDADSRISPRWLSTVRIGFEQHNAVISLINPMTDDASGTCAIRAQVFHDIRGYDERLEDWGFEDTDLYTRTNNYGGLVWCYPRRLVTMLEHSNDLRSKYHKVKNLDATWERNRDTSQCGVKGTINPGGYGLARCLVQTAGA